MPHRPTGSIRAKPEPHTRCIECPVRELALFKGIPEDRLDWTQGFRQSQYEATPKQHLYHEGQKADFAFTLFAGWVVLYKSLDNGKRQILRFALPGDFLGFQPNLEGPMSHSAQALTTATLCAFPRNKLQSMFSERAELGTRMAQMNAQYMALCQHHLLGTGRKSAKERIAFLLIELFHRIQGLGEIIPSSTEHSIEFPVAQEEIGDAVGLTTVHVNRTLKELREEGLLDIANRRLTVHEPDALAELAHFDPAVLAHHPLI